MIRVVQESLGAIPIEKVSGIVNGTTNYILTEMAREGLSYSEALAQAQELGYAEADPTEDVGGADAAAKMAILARLAFGTPVRLDQVPYEGIETIQPDDLAYAKELGLSLKLLGVAEKRGRRGQRPGLPLLPLPRPSPRPDRGSRSTPSWSRRRRSPRSRCRGPAPAGPQTASAVLGDLVSVINGGSPALRGDLAAAGREAT